MEQLLQQYEETDDTSVENNNDKTTSFGLPKSVNISDAVNSNHNNGGVRVNETPPIIYGGPYTVRPSERISLECSGGGPVVLLVEDAQLLLQQDGTDVSFWETIR